MGFLDFPLRNGSEGFVGGFGLLLAEGGRDVGGSADVKRLTVLLVDPNFLLDPALAGPLAIFSFRIDERI